MKSIILGTAGHIDHGKTALVRALTGVDTDRLKEEKDRGITIELGFAELTREGLPRVGVVDVPGHEAFVRAMVAGAAGMDVVVLVVAADEGVMPQTREHLAIVELLGVPEVVVAVTKCDTVEPEWLELVDADVAELLEDGPYRGSPVVHTSAKSGQGLDALMAEVAGAAKRVAGRNEQDLVRLPLDRVFTIQGTGTVGTGTLWSGSIAVGDKVRIVPAEAEARVRALQVHGRNVERAHAGDRTAVALSGPGADRSLVERGATIVSDGGWAPTRMLTVRIRLLAETEWTLVHNQRVHVHLGTAEALARCALLEGRDLLPGESGWVQLRLESQMVARARDRVVIRAYSPVTTIGGGVVAEPLPPKRHRLDDADRAALSAILDGDAGAAVAAALDLAAWQGVAVGALPVLTGLAAPVAEGALRTLMGQGAVPAGDSVFASGIHRQAMDAILGAVQREHERDGILPAVPLYAVRPAVPPWAGQGLADASIRSLVDLGRLEMVDGGVRSPDHRPGLSPEQEVVSERLVRLLEVGGLSPPFVDEYPEELSKRPDLWSILRHLEEQGVARRVGDGLYLAAAPLAAGIETVRTRLAGRSGLGPADFRDALPVTRKHLIPLLNYLDGVGATVREGEGRAVPAST